jgi:hypothetical protein
VDGRRASHASRIDRQPMSPEVATMFVVSVVLTFVANLLLRR